MAYEIELGTAKRFVPWMAKRIAEIGDRLVGGIAKRVVVGVQGAESA